MDGVPLSDETSPSVQADAPLSTEWEVARSTPLADTNWQMGSVENTKWQAQSWPKDVLNQRRNLDDVQCWINLSVRIDFYHATEDTVISTIGVTVTIFPDGCSDLILPQNSKF
jgi:hypothetical protein